MFKDILPKKYKSLLLLVRHGQSEWNSIGKLQGQYDSPLTEVGREQARAYAKTLAEHYKDQAIRIYSSPMSRASETAGIIANALNINRKAIIIDLRLNDYDLGQFSGKYGWKLLEEDYSELERLRTQEPLKFQPPDGELGAEFWARLDDFETSLPNDGTINLIVSHGVANKYLRSIRQQLSGNEVIALSEGQDTIYILDGTHESEIIVPNSPIIAVNKTVPVALSEHSYEVVVGNGLLENAQIYLTDIIQNRRVALISDENVLNRYLDVLAPQLDAITPEWHVYKVDQGEQAKNLSSVEKLLNEMLSDGIDRRCIVIAFGGGVVGDVGGFAAALLMRGVDFIQIPTTLMSQVDSAVGGKNGINTSHGKNLVGSFLQPKIVLNDVAILGSLPMSEIRSGYGEIIKYALIGGEEKFSWLEKNYMSILGRYAPKLIEAIRMGSEVKANIVSEDEFDYGKRAFVNLGHTFAHAFEAHAGYGSFPHGHAVGVGVIAACKLSEQVGACDVGLAERVEQHIEAARMPTSLKELSPTTNWDTVSLYNYMLSDKKTFNGKIHFVLLHGIGEPFSKADVALSVVYNVLNSLGAAVTDAVLSKE